jgi:Predicted phosphoesterases, related to the Icc protein
MSIQTERKPIEMIVDSERFQSDKRPWFGQLPEQLGTRDFSFAVMGDRCGMSINGVFEKGLEVLKDLKPEFVLFVGDLIEGYWEDKAEAHEEWDYIDAKIQETGLPFFQTIGNHDFGTQAVVDAWSERKGHEYYAFRVGDALYLFVNTEDPFDPLPEDFRILVKRITEKVHEDPDHAADHLKEFYGEIMAGLTPEQLKEMGKITMKIGDRQLAFFEKVLADNADAKHTFVTMHRPGWKTEDPAFAKLEEMLKGREYTIFSGHLHSMEYTKQDNRRYIQLGRTGAAPHGNGRGDENLVLWVTMTNGQPSFRVIHLDGVGDIEQYPPAAHHHGE